ncbi:MAG: type transporter [Frankiales bacterium]|nr:type transporter [Frankiales bacterium]
MTTSLDASGAHPEIADVAAGHGLLRVGRRDPMGLYLRKLWQRRSFAWQLSRARAGARNQEDQLGSLWTVLRPLLLIGVFALVFGVILVSKNPMHPFIPMLACGVLVFQYTSQSTTNGAKAVTSNKPLVRAIRFPRAVLPLSTVLTETLQAIPLYGIAVLTTLLFVHTVSWWWLLLPVVFLVQTMFNIGVAFVVSRLTSRVNDIAQIVPFFVRLWLYLSGVFFSLDTFKDSSYRHWLVINPVFDFIAMVRGLVVNSTYHVDGINRPPVDWLYWGPGIAWAVVLLVAGFIFFYRAEESYVEG